MWPNFSYHGVRSVQLLLLLLLLMVFSSENFGFSPPYAGIAGIGPGNGYCGGIVGGIVGGKWSEKKGSCNKSTHQYELSIICYKSAAHSCFARPLQKIYKFADIYPGYQSFHLNV